MHGNMLPSRLQADASSPMLTEPMTRPSMLRRAGYKAFMPVTWRMCSMNTNMSVVCGPSRA